LTQTALSFITGKQLHVIKTKISYENGLKLSTEKKNKVMGEMGIESAYYRA
jgi:hypothetical protein